MGLAVFLALGGLTVASIFSMRIVAPNRADAVMERHVVINNLGRRDISRPWRLYSRFSPLCLSPSDDKSVQSAENVLVFEDYPLLPVCVNGPWIQPGDVVVVLVWKDEDGNVIDIQLDR